MLALTVNGTPRHTSADPGTLLVSVLRDDLRLTGTKVGCDDGRCGSCTVLVNGRVIRSCQVTAGEVSGRDILTVEGLGAPGALHPVQRAFVEAGAVQCGFCTPGLVMATIALLDADPRPERDTVVKALGANYCRCTGYGTIFDAVDRAAALGNGDAVGPAPLPLDEAWSEIDMVTGRAMYAADLHKDGMLHLTIVRSPHPHARILAVHTGEARALPGVEAVFTSADVPVNRHGRVIQDQAVLAADKVRMIGDPIAAVVATTESIAIEAARRVRVDYELLPAITSPHEALTEEKNRIHEKGNILAQQIVKRGDVEQALAGAAATFRATFHTPFNEHAAIEPEAALAYLDEDGRVVVHTGTSHTHLMQLEVSRSLGLPLDRVHIVPALMGGHFGGRTDESMQSVLGLAALRLNRPVRCVYTRAESFATTTKRHAFEIDATLGADRDGRVTGLRMDMLADGGAYASAGTAIIVRAAVSGCGPYDIPNLSLGGRRVYTNKVLCGAMRGFGAPQSTFALESLVDEAAQSLGLHPIELRLGNALRPGARLPTGATVGDELGFIETLEAIRPLYDEAVRRARDLNNGGPIRRGVGVAAMWYGIGTTLGEAPSHAHLALQRSGRIAVFAGVTDAGQGSDFVLRRIAADTLGVPFTGVDLVRGDTDLTSDTGSCTGSRVSFYAGNAVRLAGGALRGAILSEAARELGVRPESLEIRDGVVVTHDAWERRLTLAELARRLEERGVELREAGTFDPETSPLDPTTGIGQPYATYASATQMIEADVDTRTGQIRVRHVVAAHDVGKVLNPAGARGQVEGAVVMGIGFALKEEFVPDVTRGFAQYQIPTTHDAPEVEAIFIERPERRGPFGAKGLGECALIPTAPAITNAVAHATGARIRRLPATRQRVLEALSRMQ